jgi:uncharacterized protein (TIGR03435 family)
MLTAGIVRTTKFRKLLLLAVVSLFAASAANLSAQQNTTPIPNAKTADDAAMKAPEFEVASIKAYKPEGENICIMVRFTPDGIDASGVSLQLLIRQAYGVEDNQIIGISGWMDSEQYDVQAKIDPSDIETLAKLPFADANKVRQRMLQALLADRFKLVVHRETRELPVYALVVAKGGLKMREAAEGDTYSKGFKGPDGKSGAGMMRMGLGELTGQALPIGSLVSMLSQQTGHHVVDKTGLTGKYDFTLKWTPNEGETPMFKGPAGGPAGAASPPVDDSNGPSLFTALQEQLGLKFDSQKGPVEVVVIDHAEKPSAN